MTFAVIICVLINSTRQLYHNFFNVQYMSLKIFRINILYPHPNISDALQLLSLRVLFFCGRSGTACFTGSGITILRGSVVSVAAGLMVTDVYTFVCNTSPCPAGHKKIPDNVFITRHSQAFYSLFSHSVVCHTTTLQPLAVRPT